ncbi:hypothetical protein FOMPIDRAFT_85361 [Fomitopsis schrenkii]|uniref:Uncharacterized protein n=1 Tax=Fomitopsis schrenkii TaxID=2126942 RepID=S8F0T9_FOMSC|nr:hypothetical protein FOMPIDRAFT_85361 [Fomitopsis schrenkii]
MAYLQKDELEESDEFRSSFILPDIFDNDEVEIEISSTPPPLLATSPMQRQVGTRKGVVSTSSPSKKP